MRETTESPWTQLYPEWVDADVNTALGTICAEWDRRVERSPDADAVSYFEGAFSVSQLDAVANSLACALQARGVGTGDVVGIYLQNIPQFAISMLAIWKSGATVLVLNPMYKGRELQKLVNDSQTVGIIALEADRERVLDDVVENADVWVIGTNDRELQIPAEIKALLQGSLNPTEVSEYSSLINEFAGRVPAFIAVEPSTPALLTYTSGTTGPAKGSVGTHRNALAVAASYANWQGLGPDDVVLAVAPLFHITGAVACAITTLLYGGELVFINRPSARAVVDAIRHRGVTQVIGSITVFNGILELAQAEPTDLRTIRYLYSGGAPIPPATVARFHERFGLYIHNVYGMTETSSAIIAVPAGLRAPVDPAFGTLSIGIPLPGVTARVIDHNGNEVATGTSGELEITGPSVTPGYLNRPAETEQAIPNGRLRTGDVAVMDDSGWVYLVDRMKDLINTSGYKVWPREVEDALYEHDAVLEAAVVGAPDAYRGETVVAFVSLKAGRSATEAELIAHCRERLAAYKYPRSIRFMEDLPKTQTGKIQRRELRTTLSLPKKQEVDNA
jgi:long-chain acyl-CoA synthetase